MARSLVGTTYPQCQIIWMITHNTLNATKSFRLPTVRKTAAKTAIITESKPSHGMSATIKGTYRLPSRLFGSMRRSIANTMTADANHSNAVSSEVRVSRRVSLRWTSPSRVMRTPFPFRLPVSSSRSMQSAIVCNHMLQPIVLRIVFHNISHNISSRERYPRSSPHMFPACIEGDAFTKVPLYGHFPAFGIVLIRSSDNL